MMRTVQGGWLTRLSVAVLIAGALLMGGSGCRTVDAPLGLATITDAVAPEAGIFGLGPSFSLNFDPGPDFWRNTFGNLGNYVSGRFSDALDIFEVGIGGGMGLGAQASLLAGFVGIEGGRYTWIGIFGRDQIGVVRDDKYTCVGLPLSPIWGIGALFSRGGPTQTFGGRLLGSLMMTLGFEDGIGGPQTMPGGSARRSGYRTIGPFGMSNLSQGAMSSSGPIGASVAVGPIAVIARVRAGAIINFIFGFVGYHPFQQGVNFNVMSNRATTERVPYR